MALAKSTKLWILGGVLAVVVLVGIGGVVTVPRVFGARGFCDDTTGIRLQVVEAFQETDDPGERAEAEVALAEDTAGELQDRAGRVRFPSGARDDAEHVADAWQAVADADPSDPAAVEDAASEFVELDDAYQEEHCGGPLTEDDLSG
jgi:hypothetical protein